MNPSLLLGEAACLASALCWAVAVTAFRRPIATHGARAVSLAKNSVAAVLLGATVVALGQHGAFGTASASALAWVAASGLLGLALGDTALFAAVARLGVHRALLLQSLGPVFAATLAWLLLGEVVSVRQGLAGLVIVAGVALVVAPARNAEGAARPIDAIGLGLAVLAAFGQGAGVALAKSGMQEIPVVAASFLRMVSGALGLVVVLMVAGRLRTTMASLSTPGTLRAVVPPSLLGTYLAFLLMMAGIAWAPAAVAAVLLGTTPVFGLFLDAKVEQRAITVRALTGTVVAVVGVALLAMSR